MSVVTRNETPVGSATMIEFIWEVVAAYISAVTKSFKTIASLSWSTTAPSLFVIFISNGSVGLVERGPWKTPLKVI